MSELEQSDLSGDPIDPDQPAVVTYSFADGTRRELTVRAIEAAALRTQGQDVSTRRSRATAKVRKHLPSALKWFVVAVAGAFIGQSIADGYSDRQRELELEAALIAGISSGATELWQGAQEAARAEDDPGKVLGEKAADKWVLQSGTITATFNAYFEGDDVVREWNAFQSAFYDWAVLGCCRSQPERQALVDGVRAYVDTYVGAAREPERPSGMTDPWAALASGAPAPDAYQWVGRYLLRGRSELLSAMKSADAQLD